MRLSVTSFLDVLDTSYYSSSIAVSCSRGPIHGRMIAHRNEKYHRQDGCQGRGSYLRGQIVANLSRYHQEMGNSTAQAELPQQPAISSIELLDSAVLMAMLVSGTIL